MTLSIGIVGQPNAGKSTVFNALTKTDAARVASFPFSTVEPNRAIVPVPDKRLDRLQSRVEVPDKIFTTIEFVDIAGLVEGASRGEGLGNQFLGQIRNMDALLHVVRCFDDPNVARVAETLDPAADIEIVETELMLADLEQLERAIERLTRQLKGDKQIQVVLDTAEQMIAHLNQGRRLSVFPNKSADEFSALDREMRFLTSKNVIYTANVDEDSLVADDPCAGAVRHYAEENTGEFVKIGARFEEELAGMTEAEQREFFELAGVSESGLDQVVRTAYQNLSLISFFTMNETEVRAWTIPDGWGAAQAAGVIHTDFERGFIRAEVISFDKFEHHGGLAAARQAGDLQIEGRDYQVRDGDIIYIRFNV